MPALRTVTVRAWSHWARACLPFLENIRKASLAIEIVTEVSRPDEALTMSLTNHSP
jgi:hypothetical protein